MNDAADIIVKKFLASMTKAEKIALLQNLDIKTLDYFFECFLSASLKRFNKMLKKVNEK